MRTFSYEAGRVCFQPYGTGKNLIALEGTVNYFLTEEQQMIKDLAAQIAREKIAPIALEYDEAGKFPWDIVKVLAKADLFRVFIPKEYDGLGGGIMEMALVVEELSKACGGIALAYAASGAGHHPDHPVRHRGAEEEVPAAPRRRRDPRRPSP